LLQIKACMRTIETEVLVIGGGATGTGVLRDLAMRGFKCLLVERRDLSYGTTGRFHGLLHSGARYVVKDPQAARECYEENLILRRIMPLCIEDTGGFFVLTPEDDPDYVPQFLSGCHKAGIQLEAIPITRMLKQEPLLDPHIQQCFRVPDASVDSFVAAQLNVDSASRYGAQVLTYHEVLRLMLNHDAPARNLMVTGALCHDLVKDEDVQIDASLVINASGAWAGKIVQTAGIELAMLPGKGTMLALNHRVVNTVINRCKLPADGDILVPAHTVAVIGTTDIKVTDPDHYAIEPWEIRLMLDEGEKLIPQFKQFRVLRVWAGVRPLVQGHNGETDRDISREFVLLDHSERDGVDGILTITGGKWTTYRKMAQVTVDKACEKLNVYRPCRTHLESLPTRADHEKAHQYLGARLEKIERDEFYGRLVCECELATEADIQQSIIQAGTMTLDDIRRDTRLGMGPCQAAYCAFRATGMLHTLRHLPVERTNISLKDFLQERWKGNLPILKGQQLLQARFNELVYVDVLNANSLPGDQASRLAADEYTQPVNKPPDRASEPARNIQPESPLQAKPAEVVIIGGGFAGLFAAWQASHKGWKVSLITRGWGSPYWSSGCIDVFGYQPPDYSVRIDSPLEYLEKFIPTHPHHPYSFSGLCELENAIKHFLALCNEAGYPYHGSLEANIYLPTALGTLRPTCLVPDTMIAGDGAQRTPMVIVGFSHFLDFYPALIADNLTAQGILAREISLDIKSLQQRKFITGMVLARLFDDPEFCQEVISALKPRLGTAGRIGFPAVLGLKNSRRVKQQLEASLGIPVFEIPGLPPSIPGIRLQNLLISAIEGRGGTISNGMQVSGMSRDHKSITSVYSSAAARQISHPASVYILATGGILGSGIIAENNGYAQETIFGLPLVPVEQGKPMLNPRFLASQGHPLFSIGVVVDKSFHPLNNEKKVIFDNLFAIGGSLGNCDPIRERSLEGIALATGYSAVEEIPVGNSA
jgi:glycerol-3-phosphate dehydrogenase